MEVTPSVLRFQIRLQPAGRKHQQPEVQSIFLSSAAATATDAAFAFKVKTSNPQRYLVRPSTGVVWARSTQSVSVQLRAMEDVPDDLARCRDKFKVFMRPLSESDVERCRSAAREGPEETRKLHAALWASLEDTGEENGATAAKCVRIGVSLHLHDPTDADDPSELKASSAHPTEMASNAVNTTTRLVREVGNKLDGGANARALPTRSPPSPSNTAKAYMYAAHEHSHSSVESVDSELSLPRTRPYTDKHRNDDAGMRCHTSKAGDCSDHRAAYVPGATAREDPLKASRQNRDGVPLAQLLRQMFVGDGEGFGHQDGSWVERAARLVTCSSEGTYPTRCDVARIDSRRYRCFLHADGVDATAPQAVCVLEAVRVRKSLGMSHHYLLSLPAQTRESFIKAGQNERGAKMERADAAENAGKGEKSLAAERLVVGVVQPHLVSGAHYLLYAAGAAAFDDSGLSMGQPCSPIGSSNGKQQPSSPRGRPAFSQRQVGAAVFGRSVVTGSPMNVSALLVNAETVLSELGRPVRNQNVASQYANLREPLGDAEHTNCGDGSDSDNPHACMNTSTNSSGKTNARSCASITPTHDNTSSSGSSTYRHNYTPIPPPISTLGSNVAPASTCTDTDGSSSANTGGTIPTNGGTTPTNGGTLPTNNGAVRATGQVDLLKELLSDSSSSTRAPLGTRLLAVLPPVWNESAQCYQLAFPSRARCDSNKNVQLSDPVAEAAAPALQVGKLAKDLFSVDFSGRVSVLQAFAIALCVIDQSSVVRRFL
mmetsp:Transcript_34760/g.73131  ORF Transcript_34760/g.73131 Transcript_34760/m.73131 type:complete len:770 (-) Transcript_34760:328-2637(-)